jgi:glycosyltransferase involved in cell wall biosynthesis
MLAWPFESLGGVNGVAQNLLREFQKGGQPKPLAIEISGATEDEAPPTGVRPWPLIRAGQISVWNPKRPLRSVMAFAVKGPLILWKLRQLCRRYSIGILNPHFIGLEYFPLLVMRRLGLFRGKLILSFHGLDIREMQRSRGLERYLSLTLLRGADWLVGCSSGLREEIVKLVPECAPRTVAIPNGIDAAAFLSLATIPYRLPENLAGRKVVLSVGAYEDKKGHDVLLRAFARVKAGNPEVALVIAGQGSAAAMAGLAGKLGISGDVVLLENVSHAQVAALFQRADIFALASRWEPFGLVLLEAAAAGKPVVVTKTAGSAELIRHGVTGRIVPVEDAEALASEIQDLLLDPESAARMAERFHLDAMQRFTWTEAYGKYMRLISGDGL